MPLNPFFETMANENEQELHGDMINEVIELAGVEAYYLPRTIVNKDEIFNEEEIARFNTSIPVPLFIESVDGFGGQGEFLSKFNLEIRDRITFTMSRREFELTIQPVTDAPRPKEGDLIYLPMTGGIYEIMFLDQEQQSFYQLGKLHAYMLVCELFEYNNEEFDTGIDAVDNIEDVYSTNSQQFLLTDHTDDPLLTTDNEYLLWNNTIISDQDSPAQNVEFDDEAEDIIDFTIQNPFSERVR